MATEEKPDKKLTPLETMISSKETACPARGDRQDHGDRPPGRSCRSGHHRHGRNRPANWIRFSCVILRPESMPCPRHDRTGTYQTAEVGQLRAVLMGSSRVSLQPEQDRVYLGKGCPMRLHSVGLPSRQLRLPCLYGYNPKSGQMIRLDLNPTLGFVRE